MGWDHIIVPGVFSSRSDRESGVFSQSVIETVRLGFDAALTEASRYLALHLPILLSAVPCSIVREPYS